jgi:1-pyrroline-5-carboxylate dehydrogenase
LWGAFGTTGQRCTATSRLILHEKIHDRFVQKLADRAAKLRLGPGLDANSEVGPLIHEEARQKVAEYVDIAKNEGASVALGGKIPQGDKRLECGWFYEPTVITGVKPGMRVEQEEIFGPVLAVIKAGNYDEALKIANDTEFGLTGAVYSRDEAKLQRARSEFHVGNLYLNRKCTGALVGVHPFGGFNMSGTDSKAGGRDYLLLFLQAKVSAERVGATTRRAEAGTTTD